MSIYHHWKNTFRIAAVGTAMSLAFAGSAMAQQCPDWQLGGIPITTDSETAWVPQQYPLFAGGGLDLAACSSVDGVGRVTPAPNFTLQYDALTLGRDLEFRVETDCDTTLLINDSTGAWHFNDDANGTLQPAIRLAGAPSGQYDIWVGTYGGSSCQATLVAETFPPSGGSSGGTPTQPAAPVCPEWSLGGTEVQLTAGGTETQQTTAGGTVDLFSDSCEMEAHGYVSQAPNFSLYYDPQDQTGPLNISVSGDCDTTLLVNDPTTAWLFNDDATDLQPALQIGGAQAGRYDIWVGTFGAPTCSASITMSAGSAPASPQSGK